MSGLSKILFICSDPSAFSFECRYALKDKWKVYSSDECSKMTDDEKRVKLSSSTLVIIDVLKHKNDLMLLNLAEYRKIAVLREFESRNSSWFNNNVLRADAVCKFHQQKELTNFKNIDDLIKTLQAISIDVEGNWRFTAKRFLRYLLICLN